MKRPVALIYVRVSTEEQTQNLSLSTQEKHCREFCARNAWDVDEVFIEAGESAKTANRTQLNRMIEHCRKNKGAVAVVVVYSVNRFARNSFDHQTVRAILSKYGVILRSVTEPIDDTSTGKLTENMLAAIAQFDNDVRSERTVAGMTAAAEQGRWTHKPPIGYRFEGHRSTSRLVIDEERAPFIKRAFDLFATGIHTTTEVLAIVTREGLRTVRGRAVAAQTFHALLRHQVYAGWIVNHRRGTRHRGAFPAIVDQDTFDRVQQLFVSPKTGHVRKRHNPEFPLKATVVCGFCNSPLTASKSKGRNESRYPYYRCWRAGCEKVKVRGEILESDFLRYLSDLQPKPPYVRLFREIVLDRWRESEANVDKDLAKAEQRIGELEAKRMKLLDLLTESRITQEVYDAGVDRVENELRLARMSRRELQVEKIDVEAILDYGEALLLNVATMWTEASFEHKLRIQRVILPSGVPYADGQFGNAQIMSVFSYLREIERGDSRLVAHTGFEPDPELGRDDAQLAEKHDDSY